MSAYVFSYFLYDFYRTSLASSCKIVLIHFSNVEGECEEMSRRYEDFAVLKKIEDFEIQVFKRESHTEKKEIKKSTLSLKHLIKWHQFIRKNFCSHKIPHAY